MQTLKVKYLDKQTKRFSFCQATSLGKGAYGEVFLGFDEEKKVPCAFKIINLQKITNENNAETLIKKIKDEIVNMQLAKHSSVIEFYQAKQSTNNIYIICEYCNGGSLANHIQNREYLTQWEAVKFFKEILEGFYHLRKSNIVHRDLKPANILLHHHSVKIGDLGFSKATQDHQQMLQSIVGTPIYMSPQIFQRQKYTEKTDIWSLGVILYEMLYGRNPWAGCKNLFELKQKIKKEVNFPDYPIVSKQLKQTIKKMLVVPENDRINWQSLFQKYLPEDELINNNNDNSHCNLVSDYVCAYFKNTLYLESHLQLPKVAKELTLLPEEHLNSILSNYTSSQQFYAQVLFLTQNKQLLKQYYTLYLQRRNQISFLVLLVQKILQLIPKAELQLKVYSHCTALLGYRYALTLLAEMVTNQALALPHQKYQLLSNKFGYDKILYLLLNKDMQIIMQEYQFFMPHFHTLLTNIHSHPIANIVHKDLSGIYSTDENQKQTVRFFLNNYLKKMFNHIRNTLQPPPSAMLDQNQQYPENEQNPPSLDVTVARMIGEYLSNPNLFKVIKQKGAKNLIQHMYDWQTTVKEHHYTQLQQSQPLKEDSIESFLKKQFLLSKLNITALTTPLS